MTELEEGLTRALALPFPAWRSHLQSRRWGGAEGRLMGRKEAGAANEARTHVKAEMTGHTGAGPGLRLTLLGDTDCAEGNRGQGWAGTGPRSH